MSLDVSSLTVEYATRRGGHVALDGVSFRIERGETYGLVGESGSGKTSAALAIVRHLSASARVSGGDIHLSGTNVLGLEREALRQFRAQRVSMVYQEPTRALNPTMRVADQVLESLFLDSSGRGSSRRESGARAQIFPLLERVGLTNPDRIARRYPHQISGGQAQRVIIAMALASRPELLILDEPTTGLDVQVEASVLDLIAGLRDELNSAVLLISHNLPLVVARCDRMGVLQLGQLVEEGTASEVLTMPKHAYTKSLVENVLDIAGAKPRTARPAVSPPVVEVNDLVKTYGSMTAVAGVDLTVHPGEVLAVVGESGSGKTTLGRAIAGLVECGGSVRVEATSTYRRPVQFVFQSPDATLNPRRTVRRILKRAIDLLNGSDTVEQLAARVGLSGAHLDRYPHELSGGQKQRVAIARAFAGPSSLVVCDEPVSALDASVQAQILGLLRELQASTGVSYLFISHDLAVVRSLADRVAVMKDGRIVELEDAETLFNNPKHPYTQALLAAAETVT
jgi:peptide/nickel transport system ATP-binding protein